MLRRRRRRRRRGGEGMINVDIGLLVNESRVMWCRQQV